MISALSYGAVLGLLQGRREGFRLGLAIGLVTALAVGVAVGLLLSIAPDRIVAGALFAPHEFVVVAAVAPNSAYAKSLASIEMIVGILWDTVFVATFITYLQPRFQRLAVPRDDAHQTRRHR